MDALPCPPLITGGGGNILSVVCNDHAADYRKQRGNPGNRQNFLHIGVLSGLHVWVGRLLFVLFQNHKSDCSNDNNNCGNNNDFQHICLLLSVWIVNVS